MFRCYFLYDKAT